MHQTKSILYNISIPLGREAVYKVSSCTYVVYGPPSATNTLGFCHIKVENTKKAGTAFHKCSCKGLFRRQNKRSRVLSVSIFMFSFAFDFKVTIISVSVVIFLSSRSLQHMWQTSRCYWYSFAMAWTTQERLPHLQFHQGQIWTACT